VSRESSIEEIPRLRPPEDGIVSSGRMGLVGELWTQAVAGGRQVLSDRMARGRTFARAGRVRNLRVSPGFVTAEVAASDWFPASVRVKTFDDARWEIVREVLLNRLATVAALLEHRVPADLVETLKARGVRLVPNANEIEGDCSCTDFAHPCAHVAAVHAVLAEALDGDPFLLFTLRGRPPDLLLADLRRAWGDDQPVRPEARAEDDIDPEDFPGRGWELDIGFTIQPSTSVASGLLALGPPPGQGDLLRSLAPLYEAGAAAALEVAVHDSPNPRRRRSNQPPPATRPVDPERPIALERPAPPPRNLKTASEETMSAAQVPNVPADLTERVVNALAELGSAKSKEIADKINIDMLVVREELLSLERLGIVYRTGQTRGTRWWLG
jgi:hypothetical protein